MTVVLTKENFEKTIKSGVTLVDFWAEWCGPCQTMLPVLDNFSLNMEGQVTVGKVNVDECPDLATQFRVMSIPTLIIFKDGEMVDQMVGVKQISELTAAVEKYL